MISSSRNTFEFSPMCRWCGDRASVLESCQAGHNAASTSLIDTSPHPIEDFARISAREGSSAHMAFTPRINTFCPHLLRSVEVYCGYPNLRTLTSLADRLRFVTCNSRICGLHVPLPSKLDFASCSFLILILTSVPSFVSFLHCFLYLSASHRVATALLPLLSPSHC